MPLAQESVAAATAVAGYDLLQNNIHRQASIPRRIAGVGLAGSAAALDTEVEIMVGNESVGRFLNSATGAVLRDAHVFRVGAFVPANAEVRAIVRDAAATNPINLVVDFQE